MIENDTAGEAMRRLCIGVDLKGYHELDTTDQHEAQKALAKVLAEAADATKVQRWIGARSLGATVSWLSCSRGGRRSLRPHVRESLHKGLHLHNRRRLPRLRVRLALHQASPGFQSRGGPAMPWSRSCGCATRRKRSKC